MSNLPAKKYKKTNPTITRLCFESTGNATKYIDIARALSILNRKAYRQGVYYYVNSVELYNNSDGAIDLYTAPDTYVTKNAWNMAFRMHQKMNAQVETPRPKYHDFKVKLDNLHTDNLTLDPDVYTKSNSGSSVSTSLAPDEWAFSKLTTLKSDGGDADQFLVHLVGPHQGSEGSWTSLGIIKSYMHSRSYPDPSGEPVVHSASHSDPLLSMFEASSDDALEDIRQTLDDDNDQTPYDANKMLGSDNTNLTHVGRISTTITTGRTAKISGFCAPFGLIMVDPLNLASDDDWTIVINLAVGTYNGVYAERA
ncbi:capsid protein [Delphin virus 3]|nr:capsid protein [Delphin virus 3]